MFTVINAKTKYCLQYTLKMVGAIALMKILHCKRLKRNRNDAKAEGISKDNSHSESLPSYKIKKEGIEADSQKSCRICLKEGIIPIYGNETFEDVSEPLNMFGGIQVMFDDNYPKYLCKACLGLLEGAILFRKTAQTSDQLLRKPTQAEALDEQFISEQTDENLTYESDDNLNATDTLSSGCDYLQGKKEDDGYNCKKCNLLFTTITEFLEHKQSLQHEYMRRTCAICNKSYASEYFKKHMLLHKLERPYMCEICGKKFTIQGQFTRHRLTHFYSLPFKCELCPYKGRFSESLKMHMRSHTGEKPYQCLQCPSKFVNKSNLNKHLLIHKGAHDFKCEACGRGFYTKREMDLHFKVDHTGIKDHVCNICGKPFGYRKQMMKHQLKVHKREKLRSGRTPLYLQLESKKQVDENST